MQCSMNKQIQIICIFLLVDSPKSSGSLVQIKSRSLDQKIDSIICLNVKMKSNLLGCEDHLRDSESDNKNDSEDAKTSSCSENSNDTLSSLSGMKDSDSNSDNKSVSSQLHQLDEKSVIKSRNGSTDTTGSESSSNCSGVRRSSRIKFIGMMKQRCLKFKTCIN